MGFLDLLFDLIRVITEAGLIHLSALGMMYYYTKASEVQSADINPKKKLIPRSRSRSAKSFKLGQKSMASISIQDFPLFAGQPLVFHRPIF